MLALNGERASTTSCLLASDLSNQRNAVAGRFLGLFGLSGLLFLACVSCKVGPNYVTPEVRIAGQWTGSAVSTNRPLNAAETYWWRTFEDPVLNDLVETAHRNNLSLQIAGVRVLEARARLAKSIGNLFPQQQAVSAGVNYSRLNEGALTQIPGLNPDYVSDQVLFAASWEADFWGKYRRGIESDRATFLGTIAGYEDALVTVIADVASSYVSIRTSEERIRVAERNVATQKESLRIATAQFRAGETSELDVQQAATQLATTEAQIPPLRQAMNQSRYGLAVLLGETPEEVGRHLGGVSRIPAAPPDISAGIPRDLLRRRPDVRAAGFAAASKSALIGVARASMYPSFSLAGEFGLAGNNQVNNSLTDMFTWEGRALNAGANLVFPIFNYGRLANQVRVQDAQFQQAVLQYQNTVLNAQQEVENALSIFSHQQELVTALNKAAAAAHRASSLALVQYRGGQADYTTVLTAEQAQLAVEDALATAQGNVVLGVIATYRALGGGWEIRSGNDVISEEVKVEMARRTNWGNMLEQSQHLVAEGSASQERDGQSTAE